MPDWRDAVARIADEEEDENVTLHHLTSLDMLHHAVPVLIIVHPGDASDEPGIRDALEAIRGTVEKMGEECQVIVLHRFSSVYMDPDHPFAVGEHLSCQDWFETVGEVCDKPETVQLYGDTLDAFCTTIAPVLRGAGPITVTGLWGDDEDGCAAMVARGLAERGLAALLDDACPKAHDRNEPGLD